MAKNKPLSGLDYRAEGFRAATVDEESRTVEVVMSTETPVVMFDWERWEVVPEILTTKGAEYPPQIPLLNAHNRHDMAMQLGSARSITKSRPEIRAKLHFASRANDEWELVREGHATDVSVGYQVLERTFIPRGTRQTVDGREYEGPVNVVTKWRIKEVSLCPIGADEQAKLRGFDPQVLPVPKEKKVMLTQEKREALVARGMPAELTEDQAIAWAIDNGRAEPKKTEVPPSGDKGTGLTEERILKLFKEQNDQQEAKVRGFRAEVDTACELADCQHLRAECYLLADFAAVRTRLQEEKAKRSTSVGYMPITFGAAAADTQRAGLQTALTMRALESATMKAETIDRVLPKTERSEHAFNFRHASMFEIARQCLELDGYDTRNMSRESIAIAAMGWTEKAGLRRRDAGAYHTTGSFTKLTQDAVNKSMMVGYTEFPSTWQKVFRTAPDAQDFKTLHRMRMGAIPNLPDWPDNQEPNEASFADAEETYRVEAKSLKISFSYRLLINDDMNALSRVPSMFGNAAARTVNAKAWEQITSNPTMSDGVALFAAATGARKRTNLTTGAGAPAVATLQTLTDLMMQMRGENTPEGNEGPDILALQPRYIVGGSRLSTTIKQLVLSAYDPSSANMTYNTAAELQPIIEPLLDANSTVAWYLFADTAQIDTVEVTFLAGHRSPVTRDWMDEATLSQNWAVLQAFAAKAMNHRGMQKHAGQ